MHGVLCAVVTVIITAAPVERTSDEADAASADAKTLELLFGVQAIVSVASAREEPRTEAPAHVVVITEREIRDRGYRDLLDVLHDLPGFDYSTYNFGNTPTHLLIRGINANNSKLVILRDGVPIHVPAASNKIGRNLPLHDVQRIEVLYGPASVVYGPDAVAAVVQLVSTDPAKRPAVEAEASGGSFDPLQGFRRYQLDSHVSLARRFEDVAVAASVRTHQSDGPYLLGLYPSYDPIRSQPAPFTNRFEAPIRSWNGSASLSFGRGFEVGAYLTDHAWSESLGRVPGGPAPFAYVPESVWRYRLFQVFARHEAKRGAFDLRSIVSYRDMKTSPETAAVLAGAVHHQFSQQETLRLDHRTAWTIGPRVTVTGGVRVQTFSVVPINLDLGPVPVTTGGSNLADRGLDHVLFNRYGAFALGEVQASKQVRLTAGVSYDYDENAREGAVLPRAGLTLRVSRAGTLKALYGEGFASAVPDQQYLLAVVPGVPASVPNPRLKAERMRSAELRYEHRFGQVASVDVGGFYNRDTGLQQIVPGGPVTVNGQTFPASVSFQNLGLVWSAGGDVSARAAPVRSLQLSGSYGLLYGEETLPTPGGGERMSDLAKIPRHRVLAGFTVRPLWRLTADVRFRWLGDVRTRPSNTEFRGGMMPGYHDVNLNVRAEEVAPGLDVHLLVQNLTDARSHQFGTVTESGAALPRTPQPPLRFLLGLTYRR